MSEDHNLITADVAATEFADESAPIDIPCAVDEVVVLDYGGQYSQLIARRVRECGVFSELLPHHVGAEEVARRKPKGLILSGGPASVYDAKAPKLDKALLELGIPVLGICYGMQLIALELGGRVEGAEVGEYGRSQLTITQEGALFAGLGFRHLFIGADDVGFWRDALVLSPAHHDAPWWLPYSPSLAMVLGFLIAWYFYMWQPLLPFGLLKRFPAINGFFLHAWYFDALYDRIFVRPAKWLGNFLWKVGDGKIIDGLGPNGIAARVQDITRGVVKLQTGYIFHYAFVMLIGVALLITYFIVAGGALKP